MPWMAQSDGEYWRQMAQVTEWWARRQAHEHFGAQCAVALKLQACFTYMTLVLFSKIVQRHENDAEKKGFRLPVVNLPTVDPTVIKTISFGNPNNIILMTVFYDYTKKKKKIDWCCPSIVIKNGAIQNPNNVVLSDCRTAGSSNLKKRFITFKELKKCFLRNMSINNG